jgi:hypothetical protein
VTSEAGQKARGNHASKFNRGAKYSRKRNVYASSGAGSMMGHPSSEVCGEGHRPAKSKNL